MPNDRLTIDAVRPGMRVRLVDLSPFPDGGEVPLSPGRDYVITGVSRGSETISLDGVKPWFQVHRFILASDQPTLVAVLAERAPELLEAARKWRNWIRDETDSDCMEPTPADDALLKAIERAGLIAQEPRFHLTPKQFEEMHNAG